MKPHSDPIAIAPATEKDVPALLRMIAKLAEYERLTEHFAATEERLRAALFGPRPAAEAVLARAGGDEKAVGFAVFFTTFSTFPAQSGLYLEDLFVEEPWRGQGVGRKLLAHVAQLAVERGCHLVSWCVLKWNEQAIRFYRDIGAEELEAWSHFRLGGSALAALAQDVT